jgi:hypothetical protein
MTKVFFISVQVRPETGTGMVTVNKNRATLLEIQKFRKPCHFFNDPSDSCLSASLNPQHQPFALKLYKAADCLH